MRKVRILVLDDPSHFPVNAIAVYLADANIDAEFTLESEWDDYSAYMPPAPEASNHISLATAEKRFDAIVIGNNRGEGLHRAMLVDEGSRDRTIVVWNGHTKAGEAPYKRLGFSRFGSRADIPRLIQGALAR
jgi:hypothetical protein